MADSDFPSDFEQDARRQERAVDEYRRRQELEAEVERLRAELARLTHERDAITRLLVVESLAGGDGWYVQEDLPPKVKGRYPTFEAAVAVIRKAAGLEAEDDGPTSTTHPERRA